MKPPSDLPSLLVALGEFWSRKAGIDSGDFWDYVYRRKAPPPALRAEIVEEFFPVVAPSDFLGLTSVPIDTKDRYTMQSTSSERRIRRVGRPMESEHPFARWLWEQGLTLTEWAETHKDPLSQRPFTRERAKSWMAKGAAYRPCPPAVRAMIARESIDPKSKKPAVPDTDRTWAKRD